MNDTSKNEILNEKLENQYDNTRYDIKERFEDKVLKGKQIDDLLPSVMKMVKVLLLLKKVEAKEIKCLVDMGTKELLAK